MIQQTTPPALLLDSLPDATRKAFLSCAKLDFLSREGWYLAGGTALALQVGHRISVDLDFFTSERDFDTERIERHLSEQGEWATTLREKGTLYGLFQGAKMSFIAYPSFRPVDDGVRYQTIYLLSPRDIAVMKIVAVSQRGKKRDFFDLFWLAHHGTPLKEAILGALEQYGDQQQSLPHFLKSLVYFADAEDDPTPEIFFQANWQMVKEYFETNVPTLTKELLRLG